MKPASALNKTFDLFAFEHICPTPAFAAAYMLPLNIGICSTEACAASEHICTADCTVLPGPRRVFPTDACAVYSILCCPWLAMSVLQQLVLSLDVPVLQQRLLWTSPYK
jgi:hypothetical protein